MIHGKGEKFIADAPLVLFAVFSSKISAHSDSVKHVIRKQTLIGVAPQTV